MPQRRCALRDDEHRRLIRQCGKRAAQCLFGHIVERGRGVVQNENLGVTYKCAGNGKALALSARKVAAFGGNLHIEPALTLYEVCGLRSLYGCLHLFVVGIFFAPKQVFAQRAAKQDRALQYDVHLFAQFFKRIGIHVAAIHADGAGGRIVEAGDKPHKRRFAAACAADNADDLARLGGEADVFERVLRAFVIVHENAVELDGVGIVDFLVVGINGVCVELEHVADTCGACKGLCYGDDEVCKFDELN